MRYRYKIDKVQKSLLEITRNSLVVYSLLQLIHFPIKKAL